MRTLKIGDVTITSIIERDGPWRRPEDMFPAMILSSAGNISPSSILLYSTSGPGGW